MTSSEEVFAFPTVNWFIQQPSPIVRRPSQLRIDHDKVAIGHPPSDACGERSRTAVLRKEGWKSGRRGTKGRSSPRALTIPPRRKYQKKAKNLPSVEPHLNPAVVEYLQQWRSGAASQGGQNESGRKRTEQTEGPTLFEWSGPPSPSESSFTLQVESCGSDGTCNSSSSFADGEFLPNIDCLLHSPTPKTHPWQEKHCSAADGGDECDLFFSLS